MCSLFFWSFDCFWISIQWRTYIQGSDGRHHHQRGELTNTYVLGFLFAWFLVNCWFGVRSAFDYSFSYLQCLWANLFASFWFELNLFFGFSFFSFWHASNVFFFCWYTFIGLQHTSFYPCAHSFCAYLLFVADSLDTVSFQFWNFCHRFLFLSLLHSGFGIFCACNFLATPLDLLNTFNLHILINILSIYNYSVLLVRLPLTMCLYGHSLGMVIVCNIDTVYLTVHRIAHIFITWYFLNYLSISMP